MNPTVSIIMRSRNDIRYIEQTLEMIFKQKYDDFELINVDSGSTDGTYDVIRKYNHDVVYQIEPEDYIPGRVLNDAIAKCRGEIVVFNNSDCIPQDERWLAELIKPILDGENVVATFGKQIPRNDALPLVRKDYERAFQEGEISQTWRHFFSLATSAAPRETLTKWPFDNDVQYSEDIDWSYNMKQRGFDIVYVAGAVVEHSHNYTLGEVYKRFHGEGAAEGHIYGHLGLHDRFLMKVLKPAATETFRDMVYLCRGHRLGWIPYSPVYRAIQKYAVYRGKKDYFSQMEASQTATEIEL